MSTWAFYRERGRLPPGKHDVTRAEENAMKMALAQHKDKQFVVALNGGGVMRHRQLMRRLKRLGMGEDFVIYYTEHNCPEEPSTLTFVRRS